LKCEVCGKEIEKSSYSNKVICSSECFHKDFWNQIVREKDIYLFIDGSCYWVGPEDEHRVFRGYDGRKFTIQRFDNGKIIETTNLWFRGDVPDGWQNELKDNAKFIPNK